MVSLIVPVKRMIRPTIGAGIAARVKAGPIVPCVIAIITPGIRPVMSAIIVMKIVAIVLIMKALLDASSYDGLRAVIPTPMKIPLTMIEYT